MESFYTIQGEGYYQGSAAYFIRLGGCDVGCHWCDVKESWDADKWPKITVQEMVNQAAEFPARIAVITGGEPLMYPLDLLTAHLHQKGFQTHIETSGAYPVSGEWDWFTFSPKKFKEAHSSVYNVADELKIIIFNKSDFEFAEKHAAKVRPECRLYLQPEWSKQKEMLPQMVEYVKEHPEWEISLQIHKFMDIP